MQCSSLRCCVAPFLPASSFRSLSIDFELEISIQHASTSILQSKFCRILSQQRTSRQPFSTRSFKENELRVKTVGYVTRRACKKSTSRPVRASLTNFQLDSTLVDIEQRAVSSRDRSKILLTLVFSIVIANWNLTRKLLTIEVIHGIRPNSHPVRINAYLVLYTLRNVCRRFV